MAEILERAGERRGRRRMAEHGARGNQEDGARDHVGKTSIEEPKSIRVRNRIPRGSKGAKARRTEQSYSGKTPRCGQILCVFAPSLQRGERRIAKWGGPAGAQAA